MEPCNTAIAEDIREVTPRLSRAMLAAARAGVTLPPPKQSAPHRIVHLGLGAFARAHLALYVEDAASDDPWDIIGVSLQRPDQRDRLAPQDWLYTALERGPDGSAARIVGVLTRVLVAPENPEAVLDALADPATAIVSLTITEKGYCHDPASGRLNFSHPGILHDLATPEAPRTAIGFLAEGLRRRHLAGLPPFTVLSCDNLPANGRLLAGLVGELAAARDPALAGWITREGAFPCSMVDRIVPAPVPEDAAEAEAVTGLADAAPVAHEPFRQWVIEDRFVGGLRPRWERAGAIVTPDVEPFELMKLRLLNGAHSALAYLGSLAGRQTIAEAMADPALAGFLTRFWQEVLPTVPPPPGIDLPDYTRSLAARFRNPAIRHRTWQIAMDGSQKLPQRLLGPVRARRALGLPVPCLALAIAAWARYLGGVDEAGAAIDIRDPLATSLRACLEGAGDDPAARIRALLGEAAVFGTDLPLDEGFTGTVTAAYAALLRHGARTAAGTGRMEER
jgi:fructuronate reductase